MEKSLLHGSPVAEFGDVYSIGADFEAKVKPMFEGCARI